MTFLAPVWIVLAAGASAAIVAIHLIAWQMPRSVPLPTARFVPDEPARRAARTIRLSDLGLLALRVAILMVGGLAMARPAFRAAPQGTATLTVIERSNTIGDSAVLRDSVRALPPVDRTAFVVFDTSARVVTGEEAALAAASDTARGSDASLTVGLLGAIREARRLGRDYETVDIVLVSSLSRRLFDAATSDVRRMWPDSIRVVRIEPSVPSESTARVEVTATNDDPVVAGINLAESHGLLRGSSRVLRGTATGADSAWAASGGTLVVWPRSELKAPERIDGLHAADVTVVGHFIPGAPLDSGRVVVRWLDGSAAARETTFGSGCLRTIGFDVPDVGDLSLTPAFQRLVSVLLAPCAGDSSFRLAADSMIAGIVTPPANSAIAASPRVQQLPNRLAAALMLLAVLMAMIELLVRRRAGSVLSPGRAA